MDVQDLITILLLGVCVWTFLPRHIRAGLRSGLAPALDILHDGACLLRKALTHFGYRVLLGVPVPGDIMVKPKEVEEEIEVVALATTTPQNNNNAIATPATDSNGLLLRNTAEKLALAVKAGKIGETEGIKLFFGVSPSSSNPRYLAARAALKEELAKLDPPKFQRTPQQEAAREALGLNR